MSINEERMRSLLRDLEKEDPDAEVRKQLIAGRPQGDPARTRAIALLSAHLLRDPHDLMTGAPPSWLVDLSRANRTGASLLFDSRLHELSRAAIDDLLSQGCEVDEVVGWLEDKRGAAPR